MLELFSFASFGFFILLSAAFVALMFCAEYEHNILGALTVASAVTMLSFGGNNIIPWIQTNPFIFLLSVIGYIAIGIFWSLFKWTLFVKDRKTAYVKYRAEWIEGKNSDEFMNPFIRSRFNIPMLSEYKSRILSWMAWWPAGIVNTIAFDFVRRMYKRIFTALAGVFNSISLRIYGDTLKDFDEVPLNGPKDISENK